MVPWPLLPAPFPGKLSQASLPPTLPRHLYPPGTVRTLPVMVPKDTPRSNGAMSGGWCGERGSYHTHCLIIFPSIFQTPAPSLGPLCLHTGGLYLHWPSHVCPLSGGKHRSEPCKPCPRAAEWWKRLAILFVAFCNTFTPMFCMAIKLIFDVDVSCHGARVWLSICICWVNLSCLKVDLWGS